MRSAALDELQLRCFHVEDGRPPTFCLTSCRIPPPLALMHCLNWFSFFFFFLFFSCVWGGRSFNKTRSFFLTHIHGKRAWNSKLRFLHLSATRRSTLASLGSILRRRCACMCGSVTVEATNEKKTRTDERTDERETALI